jgi:hypothetical protein
VSNRDKILRDNNLDKQQIINAMNNDKYTKDKELKKNDFFNAIDKEFKNIQVELSKMEEYKNLLLITQEAKKGSEKNIIGSLLNRILCMYENKILQIMIKVINRNNLEICALMFDGLMIYGNHEKNENLLSEMMQEVNETFNGLNMKIIYKPQVNQIIENKEDIDEINLNMTIVSDDLEACNILYERLKNNFVFSE